MTCQRLAKQFYILLVSWQSRSSNPDRIIVNKRDKSRDSYVLATKKCGLYRREDCKAGGEMALFGYADLPTIGYPRLASQG